MKKTAGRKIRARWYGDRGCHFTRPVGPFAALILSLSLITPLRHGFAGPSITNFLTVHGPNDGEPLNQCIELWLETDFQEAGMYLIFRDQTFIDFIRVDGVSSLPVPALLSSLSETVYHLDTTRFPNGPLTLNIYLIPQTADRVVAFTRWQHRIANPTIKIHAPPEGPFAEMTLEGRPGDEEFLLLASEEETSLLAIPAERSGTPNTTLAASGLLNHDQRSGASPSESPKIIIALNVDALFKIQKSYPKLVLWTRPLFGEWKRSKILDLIILKPPQKTPLPQDMPPANPSTDKSYLNGASH